MRFFFLMLLVLLPGAQAMAAAMPAAANPALKPQLRAVGAAPSSEPAGALAPSVVYTGSPALAPGAVTVVDDSTVADNLDDYDDTAIASIADPLEPWNRFWFRFNDIFYLHIAQPVYRGWTHVTPQFLRTGLSNLFYNILFPTRFLNCLLQGRPLAAGVEFSRFMMNVMGSAGLVDLASSKKTIVPMDPSGEDFGQTLAVWGIGQGFYIVWPFIGPSSLRDTFGRIGDAFTTPLFYLDPWEASLGTNLVFRFNDLKDVFPAYDDLKSIAVDPYLAMREAYVSVRRAQANR